jgi:hypothetical protein
MVGNHVANGVLDVVCRVSNITAVGASHEHAQQQQTAAVTAS